MHFDASVGNGGGMRQMGVLMNGATGSVTALNKDNGTMQSTVSTGRTVVTRPSQPQFTTDERDSPLSASGYVDIHRNGSASIGTVLSPVRAGANGTVINPAYGGDQTQTISVGYEQQKMGVMPPVIDIQPQQRYDQPQQQQQVQQPQNQYRSDFVSMYPQAVADHFDSPHNQNQSHGQTQPHNLTPTQNQFNQVQIQPQLTGTDGSSHNQHQHPILTPQHSFLTHTASTRSFSGLGSGSARQSPPPPLPPIPSGIVAPSPMVPGGGVVDVGQMHRDHMNMTMGTGAANGVGMGMGAGAGMGMGTAGQLAQVGLGVSGGSGGSGVAGGSTLSGPSSASTSSTNLNTLVNHNHSHAVGAGQANANPSGQVNTGSDGQMPGQGQGQGQGGAGGGQGQRQGGQDGMQRNGSMGKSSVSRESGSIFSLMQSETPAPPYQPNE